MVERSLADRISLALQEQIYSLAASVNQSVDEVIGAVENVVKAYERETTPTYSINVDASAVDAEDVREWVKAHRESNGLPLYDNVDEAGGREEGTPLSREQLLREVYRYVSKHSSAYLPWNKDWEDGNATTHNVRKIEYLLDDLKETLVSEKND